MSEKSARSVAPSDAPWEPRTISLVAHFVLLLGAAGAVFLSGSAQQGSLGAFLVVAGVALLGCPPQVRLDGKICALAAGLVFTAALALLPQSWFPEPAWRASLSAAGIALPASVTPMIRETGFWLAVFAVAVLVGLFGLAHPLRSTAQLAAAVTAVVICALYAGLARYAHHSGWEYPFDYNPEVFGFFKNINHTSSFLVTGSVVALAILGVAFRGRHWVAGSLAAASLVVCVTSIFFFTSSRAGVLSLLFGVLLWFIGVGANHRSKPLLVSFGAVFLASILLFLASQSTARQRLLTLFGFEKGPAMSLRAAPEPPGPGPAETVKPLRDFRALIYADTIRIIRDYPLTGAGFGTFPYLFPLYRERSLNDAPSVHPESDWLMLAAEAGLPALLLLWVAIGLLLRRMQPWRKHPYWPLRWGLLCATLAALFHGFVDVPSHLLGWWILAIGALGFQMRPRVAIKPSRIQHGVFVLAGLGALVLGVPLLRAQWFGGFSWPPMAPTMAAVEVYVLRDDGKLTEAVEVGREAIRQYPLAKYVYKPLSLTLLDLKGHEAEAEAMLRAERLLGADSPMIPIDQGQLWIDRDPGKTAALWQEAVQMRQRIDDRQQRGKDGALALYADLLRRATKYPDLQRELLGMFGQRSDFLLVWLEAAAPAVVATEITRLVGDPVFLHELSEAQRRRLLQAWYGKGDRESLFRFIEEQRDWHSAAWPILVRRMTDAEAFKEATEAVAGRYGIFLTLEPPGAEEPQDSGNEPASEVGAFHAAWRKGNAVAARRILEEARAKRSVSPEVWRLSAAVSAFDEQWAAAWQYLERYLRESGRSSLP